MVATMAKNRPASAPATEHPLLQPLERIADELNLIRTVLDEIRSDYQWAVQNRRPQFVDTNDFPAVDNVRLTLFDEGDAVEVDHNRLQGFGEILAVDDATNLATVLMIPSNEHVTVLQDALRKVEGDRLNRSALSEVAGVSLRICCHTFRVARTQYMQNDNTPENTQQKAAHASIETNNLHNRVRTPSYASTSNA
ncbi:MAG: hypothetical protein RIK87_29880 [Fuerstiella sp.]